MKRSKSKISKIFIVTSVVAIIAGSFIFIGIKYKNTVVKKATEISESYQVGRYFLGFEKPLKILILFQNNAEVRHGGGFIGTVGFVEISNGHIESRPIRSVYYYDHPADDPNYFLETTRGINGQLETRSYTLRDSGQNMSWPSNAQRAKKIFFQEANEKADVVLGITPELLKHLLNFTGPVYLADYNKEVSSGNLLESIQLEVESGKDKHARKDPKSVLTSVANVLVQKISSKNIFELISLLASTQDLFNRRQIVVYSSQPAIQNYLDKERLSGSFVSFSGDYLQISERSLSGTKTGPFIERSINRQTKIKEDGSAEIHLSLSRKHLAKENLYKYFDPVFNGYKYLVGFDEIEGKIAIPKKSKILYSSSQLNLVDRESHYDIYSYIIRTDLDSESALNISYETPYSNYLGPTLRYGSFTQMPVGNFGFKLKDCIIAPADYNYISSNIDNISRVAGNEVCYDAYINKDQSLEVNYAKK